MPIPIKQVDDEHSWRGKIGAGYSVHDAYWFDEASVESDHN